MFRLHVYAYLDQIYFTRVPIIIGTVEYSAKLVYLITELVPSSLACGWKSGF